MSGDIYVLRVAATFTAIGGSQENVFSFNGPGGAGSFISLPYQRLRMIRMRTNIFYEPTAADTRLQFDHQITLRSPGILSDVPSFATSVTNPIQWSPDAPPAPLGSITIFRSAVGPESNVTPGYILSRDGFAFDIRPISQTTGGLTSIAFVAGDQVFVNTEWEFLVIED